MGMARLRDERSGRYRDHGEYLDDRDDRKHRRRHKDHRHDAEPALSSRDRERRERRRAEETRRQPDVDVDELRARRESYYARNEAERRRDRERDRIAHESRRETVKDRPSRSSKDVRRDSTRRSSKKRNVIPEDEDFVFGRPKSMGHVEDMTVRRPSTRKRSEEGASSNRTAYTPVSGSGSASVRRAEVPIVSR